MFIKGGHTSEKVTQTIKDLVRNCTVQSFVVEANLFFCHSDTTNINVNK